MKSFIMSLSVLLLGLLFIGCSSVRLPGKTYYGYSCRDSLMHYFAHCSDEKISKDDFEVKVQECEKELATKVCDKQQAEILWCKGRAWRGTYSQGSSVAVPVGKGGAAIGVGGSSTTEGCDCSIYEGELKKCLMKLGIFDKK